MYTKVGYHVSLFGMKINVCTQNALFDLSAFSIKKQLMMNFHVCYHYRTSSECIFIKLCFRTDFYSLDLMKKRPRFHCDRRINCHVINHLLVGVSDPYYWLCCYFFIGLASSIPVNRETKGP